MVQYFAATDGILTGHPTIDVKADIVSGCGFGLGLQGLERPLYRCENWTP